MKNQIMPKYMKIFLACLSILTIIFYSVGFTILKFSGYNFSQFLSIVNFSELNQYFSESSINTPSSNTFTIDSNITTLDIQFKHQDINLYSYDGNDLKIEVKNNNSINNNLYYTVSSDKAIVKPLNTMSSNAVINITMPNKFLKNGLLQIDNLNGDICGENFIVKSINISSVSGDIKLSNINSEYMSLSNKSGDIECEDVTVSEESNLKAVSGDINCEGDLGKLSASSISGDIEIFINKALSTTLLDTSSGSLKLDIPSSSEYKIYYNTVSGDCNADTLNHGNNPSQINLKTISGDIDVSTHD